MGKFDGIRLDATVVRVIDGDTVVFTVESLFDSLHRSDFRLLGINAPETRGEQRPLGLASKEFLIETLPEGQQVELEVHKKEKYGRYLAVVYKDGVSINDLLVQKGFAKPYMV